MLQYQKDAHLIHRLVFPQVLAVCTVFGVIIIGKVWCMHVEHIAMTTDLLKGVHCTFTEWYDNTLLFCLEFVSNYACNAVTCFVMYDQE